MSNAIISYPDLTLSATALSGGSWLSSLPLSLLQDQDLANKCRSTDDAAASSIILVDLGAAQAIRVISLCAHNISEAGTIQARGYSDAGYTTLVSGADTTALDAWPTAFTAATVAKYPKNWTFCFTTAKTARYWKIEITDTTNPDGYIELGRLWLGSAIFEPALGISYGSGLGYISRDVIEESLGGVLWGEKRTPKRELTATFEVLTPAEKRLALIMQKELTTTDEAFWVGYSGASADDMLLEAFPCYFKATSPLTYPYFNNNEMPINIVERI